MNSVPNSTEVANLENWSKGASTLLPTHIGTEARRKGMIVEIPLDAKVGAFMHRDCAVLTAEWLTFRQNTFRIIICSNLLAGIMQCIISGSESMPDLCAYQGPISMTIPMSRDGVWVLIVSLGAFMNIICFLRRQRRVSKLADVRQKEFLFYSPYQTACLPQISSNKHFRIEDRRAVAFGVQWTLVGIWLCLLSFHVGNSFLEPQ